MNQAKQPIKDTGKPSWNTIETRDGPSNERLCKQLEELNKRVSTLEIIIKKLDTRNEMKERSSQTSGSIHNRSFIKQKSLNIKLVDISSQENGKIPKTAQISKEAKLASPSSRSPMTAPASATPSHYRKPQTLGSKTSGQVEPFMSRKNLATVGQTPPVQNGFSSKDEDSAVRNFAKRYEELSRSQTNLNRIKSQSAADVVTLQFEKRKSNPESKKMQLSLIPQNKDSLSSSLNVPPVAHTEVKNRNPPAPPRTPTPPPSKSPLPVSGPPAAPPPPKSEMVPRSARRNSEASIKSQSRSVEPADDVPHDALMGQLKEFADKGFPFKRQIGKETYAKTSTWNFSKK